MRIDKVSTAQPLVIRLPDGKMVDDEGKPLKGAIFDWSLGTETDMVLQCVSMESSAVRAVARKIHKANIGKKEEDQSLEEKDQQLAELYAAAVVDWSGVENADGPVPYSQEKVLEYLMKPELRFVFEQVQMFVSERAKFFPGNKSKAAGNSSAASEGPVKKQSRVISSKPD